MKLKNKDVIEIMSSLNLMGKEKLPIKLSWKIETARRVLEPFYETATKIITEIKQEKALKNPDGSFISAKDKEGREIPNTLIFDNKDVELLNKEITEVLEQEIEVQNVIIKIDDFPDDVELSPDSLHSLKSIIE